MGTILNKQKHIWCDRYAMFSVFPDNTLWEHKLLYNKGGYNYWDKVPYDIILTKNEPIGRLIVKSKVDEAKSVGKSTVAYKK